MESQRARNPGREITILLLVLAVLAFLVWLFLRPGDLARDIVFGELGRRVNLADFTSSLPQSGNSIATNGRAPIAGFPTNESGRRLSLPTNEPTGNPPVGQLEPGRGGVESNARPANTATETSNSVASTSNQTDAAPAQAAPQLPAPTRSQARKLPPFEDSALSTPEPSYKPSTSALLAQDREAARGLGNSGPARTEDLLANNAGISRVFDPDVGSNVVFVIDNSMTMMTNGKSLVARQAVAHTLELMNPTQTFYVLLFHTGGYEGMPSLAPLPASPENVHAMTNWLFNVGHRSDADPVMAIERAEGLTPGPDTIWLLSASEIPDRVVDRIREANLIANAHINTVAFWSRMGEAGLRRIADENRGTFQYVPPPNRLPP
jgi:hypothetical protein